MKLKNIFLCAAILFAVLFTACKGGSDYVQVIGEAEYEQEKIFLESLFEKGGELERLGLRLFWQSDEDENLINQSEEPYAAFVIEFLSSWEHEADFGDIIISKTFLVPSGDPVDGRANTTFASCIEGSETLVTPQEIAPPFVALRVDGLALGDEGYPLVRTVGIRLIANEENPNKRLLRKIHRTEEALKKVSKPYVLESPRPFWIAIAGDSMFSTDVTGMLLNDGPESLFRGTAEIIASSDLSLLNFEGVASDIGDRVPKSYNFRFSPELVPALKSAGIDAVLHANNHVFDFGEDAFLDSISHLKNAGIGVMGAGVDIESASDPVVFTRGDETYQVFGLASFPREWNGWDGVTAAAGVDQPGMLHALRGGVEKLKDKFSPDAVNILFFHGGVEWSTRPNPATRALYTDLAAAGADLIVGSHPHLVQGFEWVHGKPVFWSLGNFVFGDMGNDGTEQGIFVRLGFWQGILLYLDPFALTLTNMWIDIAPQEELELFYSRSRALRAAGQ